MVRKINFQDFVDEFKKAGRENQFSHDALELIFNYLENVEKEAGTEVEFDPIAICCNFSEYTVSDFNSDFGTKFSTIEEAEEYLDQYTFVIGKTENSIVFENY